MTSASFLESPYVGFILASYAVVLITTVGLALHISWQRRNITKALQQLDDA